jgi:hypothetical protein
MTLMARVQSTKVLACSAIRGGWFVERTGAEPNPPKMVDHPDRGLSAARWR